MKKMKESDKIEVYFITFSNRHYKGGIIGLLRKLFSISNECEANFYVEAYNPSEAIQLVRSIRDFHDSNFTDVEISRMNDVKLRNNKHQFTPIYAYETNEGRILIQLDSLDDLKSLPADATSIGRFTDSAYFIKQGSYGY